MMSSYTGGGISAQEPCTGHRPSGGVIHNGAVLQQTLLEAIGAFANIMGKPHQLSLCLRAERACERAAQRCGSCQMLCHRLSAAIV